MALNGIDIASFQSSIVPANLLTTDFVIVKATQGISYINPYFKSQYEKSKAAGKLVGIYHYIDGSGAEAQADFFLKAVKSVNGIGEAILAVDQEQNMNKKWRDSAYVKKIMDRIYSITKVKPFLYVQQSAAADYNNIQASGYPLWGAAYANTLPTNYQSSPWSSGKGWGKWGNFPTIRQYSDNGSLITGYNGNIDLDLFYGSKSDWKKYAMPEQEKTLTTIQGSNTTSVSTKQIQKMLNVVGDYGLLQDGVYGKLTTAAVVSFQKKYNLYVDGIVGNQTLTKLQSLYDKKIKTIPVYKDGDYSKIVIRDGIVSNTSLLNVRTGAGLNYKNISTYPIIKKGTKVGICMKVKSGKDYWYYVKLTGNKGTKYGFVHSDYITLI